MLLTPTELAGAVTVEEAFRRHEETVFRAVGELSEEERDFDVPLDSTIESVHFFVSVQCLTAASLIRPSGEEITPETQGVEQQRFEAIRLFTIRAPVPGVWKTRVRGRGFFSVIVQARTDLKLLGVTVGARGGPPVQPPSQTPQPIEATLTGVASQVAFQLLTPSAAAIEQLALTPAGDLGDSRTYVGQAVLPATDFRIAMTGLDARNFPFQRVSKLLFTAAR